MTRRRIHFGNGLSLFLNAKTLRACMHYDPVKVRLLKCSVSEPGCWVRSPDCELDLECEAPAGHPACRSSNVGIFNWALGSGILTKELVSQVPQTAKNVQKQLGWGTWLAFVTWVTRSGGAGLLVVCAWVVVLSWLNLVEVLWLSTALLLKTPCFSCSVTLWSMNELICFAESSSSLLEPPTFGSC